MCLLKWSTRLNDLPHISQGKFVKSLIIEVCYTSHMEPYALWLSVYLEHHSVLQMFVHKFHMKFSVPDAYLQFAYLVKIFMQMTLWQVLHVNSLIPLCRAIMCLMR